MDTDKQGWMALSGIDGKRFAAAIIAASAVSVEGLPTAVVYDAGVHIAACAVTRLLPGKMLDESVECFRNAIFAAVEEATGGGVPYRPGTSAKQVEAEANRYLQSLWEAMLGHLGDTHHMTLYVVGLTIAARALAFFRSGTPAGQDEIACRMIMATRPIWLPLQRATVRQHAGTN